MKSGTRNNVNYANLMISEYRNGKLADHDKDKIFGEAIELMAGLTATLENFNTLFEERKNMEVDRWASVILMMQTIDELMTLDPKMGIEGLKRTIKIMRETKS